MTHVAEYEFPWNFPYSMWSEEAKEAERQLVRQRDELIEYPSGVLRGDKSGKVNFLLVRDGPMLDRWARLLSGAVAERGARNWMKASSADDMERFRESAARHFEQWLGGAMDEDHAAATIFNINGVEYTKGVLGLPSFVPAV